MVFLEFSLNIFKDKYFVCLLISTEQMDEGLLGRQRQYEGWILNLSRELNHYKATNLELNSKLRELCGSVSQPKEHLKGTKVFSHTNHFVGLAAAGGFDANVPVAW